MNIFVAKLAYVTDQTTLRAAFEEFGEVDTVKVIMDRDTGKSKGFGFIEMPIEEEARTAISELNNSNMDGRTIVVKEAVKREDHNNNNRNRRDNDRGGYNRNRY